MTPFQANLSISEGAYLIEYGFERGINFLDTAEIYDNYAYIKKALLGIKREDYCIASKTYAYTKEMAKDSLEKALKGAKAVVFVKFDKLTGASLRFNRL